MRVSIGMPAYNAERFLGETLDSVMAQTFTDWECVIVNDGSRDGTEGVAKRYAEKDSRIRYVNQENGGVAAARNRAFKEMGGSEYAIFLDADDLWDADALEVMVRALDAAPDAVGAHGTGRYIDADGHAFAPGSLEDWCDEPRRSVTRWIGPIPEDRTTFTVMAWRSTIPTPGCVLIRRSCLEKVGEWNQCVAPCEDWDIYLKLSAQGDFAYLNRPVLSYRKHGSGGSSNQKRMTKSCQQVRRNLVASPLFTAEQKSLYRRCYFGHNYQMLLFFRDSFRESVNKRDAKAALVNLFHLAKRTFVQVCRVGP